MNMWLAQLSISVLICLAGASCVRINRLEMPEFVDVNTEVALGCDYDPEGEAIYMVKWYKDGVELYRHTASESPPGRAYRVSAVSVDVADSDARYVHIIAHLPQASGRYTCEVSADAPTFHTSSLSADLHVLDAKRRRLDLRPSGGARPSAVAAQWLLVTALATWVAIHL